LLECKADLLQFLDGKLLSLEEEGLHGVFKRLSHNGHLTFQKAANSSAQTVTQGGSPPKEASLFH
jgi:hypothetical protein